MDLLLTGGTGFFGRALLRRWVAMYADAVRVPVVTVLSRSPEEFVEHYPEFSAQPWLSFHRGNVLDPSTLPDKHSFTHLLHAAADSTFGPSLTPLERYEQIVDGTRNLLEFAAEKKIQRFLLTSSGGIYGPQPRDLELIPETYNGIPDPLNAANAYSLAKRCAEHMCVLYQERYGIDTVIARCFAFVGRDLPLDVHFAIGNFIRDALLSTEITVNSDGTPVRSYMDQRDLADWLIAILERGAPGQAYNVGSDQALTIRELAHIVRDIIAPEKPIKITKSQSQQSFRDRYVPEVKKALVQLGLRPSYSLEESILEVARWKRT